MPTITRLSGDIETKVGESYKQVIRTDRELTLEWDYFTGIPAQYNLYYRAHNTTTWQPLDSVTSESALFILTFDRLGEGDWDFGVTAVDSNGNESKIHSSLDDSADPETGWFLTWKKPQ